MKLNIKRAAYKVAKGTLATGHFVADSVADMCIHLEMKLDSDVDPSQVACDRMRETFETRQAIINKAKSLLKMGSDAANVVIMKAEATAEEFKEFKMMESVTVNNQ